MPLSPAVRELAVYLKNNPAVRNLIRARPGKTLLYAGSNFKACWKEISEAKLTNDQVADKQTLPEVLALVAAPGSKFANLRSWMQQLDLLAPYDTNGFLAWRMVSGVFAANAVGAVSFWLGKWEAEEKKVFAFTEVHVLRRNKNVDGVTQDLLEYYVRCIERKKPEELVSFLAP